MENGHQFEYFRYGYTKTKEDHLKNQLTKQLNSLYKRGTVEYPYKADILNSINTIEDDLTIDEKKLMDKYIYFREN
jgi:antitoxin component YwqK of YwqJK toxin-antitoxin module